MLDTKLSGKKVKHQEGWVGLALYTNRNGNIMVKRGQEVQEYAPEVFEEVNNGT